MNIIITKSASFYLNEANIVIKNTKGRDIFILGITYLKLYYNYPSIYFIILCAIFFIKNRIFRTKLSEQIYPLRFAYYY